MINANCTFSDVEPIFDSTIIEVRSCRVTISDMDGVAHTVEVTAATLFEAVALGLKQLQGNEWVAGIGRPGDAVIISVKSIPVEHRVRINEFTKWLERSPTNPAETLRKQKVREILGLPAAENLERKSQTKGGPAKLLGVIPSP